MTIARSLLVSCVLLSATQLAHAECAIDRVRPTDVVPTRPKYGQMFAFVATDDCTRVRVEFHRGADVILPFQGAAVGVAAHAYWLNFSDAGLAYLVGPEVLTLTWSVTGTSASGELTRVTTTNELDFDFDGWTRTDGDVGACDADPERNPGATEVCGNGVDEDCDGLVDNC